MSTNEPAAGAAAEQGEVTITVADAKAAVEAGSVDLIDVRTEHEWNAGHIPGARHILLNELPSRASDLDADRRVVICCRAGNRSVFAAEGLREAGFDAVAIDGGALAWEAAGLEFEPQGGYVAESGEAAAVLDARARTGTRPDGISY